MLDDKETKIINELNNEENIKNLVVFPLLIVTTLFDKFKILTTNFHPLALINSLISILLALLNLKDTTILENKKMQVDAYESSKFNKVLNRINKKVDYTILFLNIFIFLIHSVGFTTSSYSKLMVCRENPYQDKKITYASLDNDHIEEAVLSAVSKNVFLNEDEKSEIKSIVNYFKENKYLELDDLYYDLLTLKSVYEDNSEMKDEGIVASYNHFINEISIYDEKEINSRFSHEVIHSTGYLSYSFLNEGLTSLLKAEYCDKGVIKDGYHVDIYLTEMIIEIVGKDTLLEAYSKKDDDILIDAMAKKSSGFQVKALLNNLNSMVINSRDNDSYIDFNYKMKALMKVIDYMKKEEFSYEKNKKILEYFLMCEEHPQTISKYHFNREYINQSFDYVIRPEIEEMATTLSYLISDTKDYNKVLTRVNIK